MGGFAACGRESRVARSLQRLAATVVAAVAATCVGAQAVLWQVPATTAPQPGLTGLGLAPALPGAVYVGGDQGPSGLLRWVTLFSASGTPLDAQGTRGTVPADGGSVFLRERATAIAPGLGGALVAGWYEECQSVSPGPPACVIYPWLERYTQAGMQWRVRAGGYTAATADSGGAYVAGLGALVQKFDVAGNLQWQWTPAIAGGAAHAATSPASGGIVVAGASDAGALLQSLGTDGVARWPSSLVAALGPSARFEKVAVDAAGNVIAAGTRAAATPGVRDIVVAKFDANGVLQWTRTRAGMAPARASATTDAVKALAVDGRGDAIVAATASAPTDYVAWTAKFDAVGGLAWNEEFAAGAGDRTEASAIGVDASGDVYVGGNGYAATRTAPEGYVRKLGRSGTAMWTVRLDGRLDDVVVGTLGEVVLLADLPSAVTLVRLDPGAAEGAPAPSLRLVLPTTPPVAGAPFTLGATVQGTLAPTGVAAFLVNGVAVCGAAPLQPIDAVTSRAECVLQQGLPAGWVRLAVAYGGDARNGSAGEALDLLVASDEAATIPVDSPWALAALAASIVAAAGWLSAAGVRASRWR